MSVNHRMSVYSSEVKESRNGYCRSGSSHSLPVIVMQDWRRDPKVLKDGRVPSPCYVRHRDAPSDYISDWVLICTSSGYIRAI